MKRPSFQFYPADWKSNSNLRRCSPAARGVWMDVLCLLHDSDEYGILRWTLKEIAMAAGASMTHVRELVTKGVLKGSDKRLKEPFVYIPRSGRKDGDPVTLVEVQDGPVWFSSRMVKDEYVRQNAGKNSRFGAPSRNETPEKPRTTPTLPDAPKPSPTRRHGEGQGDGSTSSSPSSPSDKSKRHNAGASADEGEAEVDPSPSRKHEIPKLEAVQAYARSAPLPIPSDCATAFFDTQEAAGWITKHGHPIADWRAALRRYASNWNEFERNKAAAPAGAGRSGTSRFSNGYNEEIPLP